MMPPLRPPHRGTRLAGHYADNAIGVFLVHIQIRGASKVVVGAPASPVQEAGPA